MDEGERKDGWARVKEEENVMKDPLIKKNSGKKTMGKERKSED